MTETQWNELGPLLQTYLKMFNAFFGYEEKVHGYANEIIIHSAPDYYAKSETDLDGNDNAATIYTATLKLDFNKNIFSFMREKDYAIEENEAGEFIKYTNKILENHEFNKFPAL